MKLKFRKYVIMSKDRKVIAKGSPRNRHLVKLDDTKDKKRILYYDNKKVAINAYTACGFFIPSDVDITHENRCEKLEPVLIEITISEIKE